jgi:aminopeptidase N
VTRSYDAAAKQLTLKVRQEQKPDTASAYPQVEFFRAPVEVEIETTGNKRIERVMIEPREEQTFSFTLDSAPLLVNFDYGSTLIKELKFDKPTDELVYQLTRDEDVTGRLWALGQLTTRLNEKSIPAPERQKIAAALGASLGNDRFWGVRADVATAIGDLPDTEVRTALLAATKDKDARVRANAVTSLGKSKDPQLASVYLPLLNDQSYATIRAAALALGDAKDKAAYDALVKLLDTPSWRDQMRTSALAGLANLGDKRALEIGIRYAGGGHSPQVRAAGIALLGSVGRDDPRTFQLISDALSTGVSTFNFALSNSAGEALVKLGDPRGIEVIEQAIKTTNSPQLQGFIRQFQQRLRQSMQPAAQKPAGQ